MVTPAFRFRRKRDPALMSFRTVFGKNASPKQLSQARADVPSASKSTEAHAQDSGHHPAEEVLGERRCMYSETIGPQSE